MTSKSTKTVLLHCLQNLKYFTCILPVLPPTGRTSYERGPASNMHCSPRRRRPMGSLPWCTFWTCPSAAVRRIRCSLSPLANCMQMVPACWGFPRCIVVYLGFPSPNSVQFTERKDTHTCTPETVYRVAICHGRNLPYIQNYPINNTVFNLILPVGSWIHLPYKWFYPINDL